MEGGIALGEGGVEGEEGGERSDALGWIGGREEEIRGEERERRRDRGAEK